NPGFGHRLALPGKRSRLARELFKRCGALVGRHFVLNVRPTLLDPGQALLVSGVQRPDALAQGGEQQANGEFFHGLRFSLSGCGLRRRISGDCLRKPRSTKLGSRLFRRTKKRSGQPRYKWRRSAAIAWITAEATVWGASTLDF